ncbi:MAG: SurA N-terminal domain-containing protein [Paludibacteraceae bacterium]|nr:SurA N-terminal domain-containing protein [Paludibacteraceae bacterium]
MATLQKIRNRGVLLLVVIGAALLAFIIGDFLNNSSSILNQDRDNIAEINGKAIKLMDYQNRVDEFTEVVKIEQQVNSLNAQVSEQIRRQVWTELITEGLLNQEAEELGLSVSEQELQEQTVGSHPNRVLAGGRLFYNQQGGFDVQSLINYLSQPATDAAQAEQKATLQKYWNFYRNQVKNNIVQTKYNILLAGAINVNKLEAKQEFASRRNISDVSYVVKNYGSVDDKKVNVTEEEIDKKYEDLKSLFYQPVHSRDAKIVLFQNSPSQEDQKKAEEWINKLQPEFASAEDIADFAVSNAGTCNNAPVSSSMIDPDLKDFAFSGAKGQTFGPQLFGNVYKMARIVETGISAPDSLHLRQIAIQGKDSAEAKQLADSILTALKGGAEFATLAQKYNGGNGDLGWQSVYAIESNPSNERLSKQLLSAATQQPFIFSDENNKTVASIFIVEERTANVRKVRLAIIPSEIVPSKQTTAANFNKAKEFAASCNNNVENFEPQAKKKGYTVENISDLTSDQTRLGMLENSGDVINWILGPNTEKGNVSDVFDCGETFIVAAVSGIHEKGYRTLEDEQVKNFVKQEAQKDKKADLIIKEMQGVADINALAAKLGVQAVQAQNIKFSDHVFGTAGYESAVIGATAFTEVGKTSAPVKGENGVYVVRVDKKYGTSDTFDEKTEGNQLLIRYRSAIGGNDMYNGAIGALYRAADVKDNRSALLR